MSALRLYLDEDATQHALVEALRMRDVDVTFALEVRMRAASDEDQLVWCEREGRVLDSFNVKDFSRLHKTFAQMESLTAECLLRCSSATRSADRCEEY